MPLTFIQPTMDLLFINLGKIELAVIVLLQLAIVIYAIFRVLSKEKGLAKILWVIACVAIPLVAVIYVLHDLITTRK